VGWSMPDLDRLRTTLQRAIAAFRSMPGQRGRVVPLHEATEVLVAGDLHGNLVNFRRILEQANLAHHAARHLVFQEIIHGPHRYPDGGDKSHQLVDLLAALKCQYPQRVHYLPGNHELAQATGRKIGKEEDDLNQRFRDGVRSAYAPRDDEIDALYRDLFASAPLALRTANRVLLTHSLPNRIAMERFDPAALERDVTSDMDVLPGGSVYALLWGRDTREQTASDFLTRMNADLLITGHIPCERGFDVPNGKQLILDSLGTPACYCLFPADRPLTRDELVGCVRVL
jgi:hypothetical protein